MDNFEILSKELDNLDILSIQKFSFKNYTTLLKIIKVIDGDSIIGVFKFNNIFYKYNFRINGIDTPEIHSKNIIEKNKGIAAKEYLTNKILNKILLSDFLDFDKYGRILVNIYIDENYSISDDLIQGGYAYSYDGKTKSEWV